MVLIFWGILQKKRERCFFMSKFEKLASPVQIGRMQLPNRMVMAPMVTNYSYIDGSVTGRLLAYLAERAAGGVGMIITEAAFVKQSGKGFPNQLGVHSDRLIPGLRKLTEEVHRFGTKICLQLYHGGRQTSSAVTGSPIVAPSPIPDPIKEETPRELSAEEIREIVAAFGAAARRAVAAGFDAVELHGANGYLINQFLSPHTNRRTDEYGGSFENRMRFPLEIVQGVRKAVGPDFPIIYRLGADEKVDGGLTLEETKAAAKRLEEEGVNALHVSAGIYESAAWIVQPYYLPRGCLVDLARGIKSAVTIPVIAVGRFNDLELAEAVLAKGEADLIAFGRQLLTDPDTPAKVIQGRLDDIRRCIACCQACIDELFLDHPIGCTVNARTGFEEEFPLDKSSFPRRVLVVGGGVSGMEVARVAALRGHNVTLWEKTEKLGGQIVLAALPPQKDEIALFREYLIGQLKKLNVNVKKNKEATLEAIRAEAPDVVVVATGARPAEAGVPGAERKNVVNAWDVLAGRAEAGEKVAIIGGGLVGCDTADYLAEKGREVTIVEALPQIAEGIGPLVGAILLGRLEKYGVKVVTGARLLSIDDGSINVEIDGNNEVLDGFDTVVLAMGSIPDDNLAGKLEGTGIEYYVIGDAWNPRRITHAVYEAMRVGHEL
jgi:2,4-dienoyl-CoA reductase-like NADH-dependent reductase (Old Yellow Enzyme family)/thioredoxin reductase